MTVTSTKTTIWKLTSGGNDFVAIDNFDRRIGPDGLPELARRMCHRRFGVGADGMFLVEPSDLADIFMHFFNADGSEVGVCGNALRCISHLARQLGYVGDRFTINTIAETYRVAMDGSRITLTFPPPRHILRGVAIDLRGVEGAPEHLTGAKADLFDMGVPHLVVHVERGVDELDLEIVGKFLRHYAPLGPAGANANFIEPRGAGVWRMRTYERGVEGETLSCGSGAAACGVSVTLRGLSPVSPIEFLQSGGGSLFVEVERGDDGAPTAIRQTGAATAILKGEVEIEFGAGRLHDALRT